MADTDLFPFEELHQFTSAELQQYATPIFNLCIQRAQGYKKVGPCLVSTWSVFLARYGPRALWQQLESIQPGLALGARCPRSMSSTKCR